MDARFTLLDSTTTGVSFVNRLSEGPNTNILVYEYFYNGAGVATGDFDGDGRPDLYFVSNMGHNRLYLNRGDFQFEDRSATSGAGGRAGPWKTGVSVVDINMDGRDDIYLCYSGMLPPAKRRNQLFINLGTDVHGDPKFVDQAAAYGLDAPSFTNQAYFFDYDTDGDLDCALLNHNPKSLPILNPQKTKSLFETPDPERGLRLYRNESGKFRDVTEESGLNGSALSYGLGLIVTDLDDDGLPDLYVSNDYEVPDYLYMNNGDGTFTDRLVDRLGLSSHFSMGSDAADVNNDGRIDLLTLDMLPLTNRRDKLLMPDNNRRRHALNAANGYAPQHMRNMLHLATGADTYAEVGRHAGIAATDWSWSARFADLDNDGHQDLHVTNGYLRDYTNLDFIKYMEDFVSDRGRLQRTDVLELLTHMPESGVSNQVYRGHGDGTFENTTTSWGMKRPSNSSGAIVADLDADGDLDLVTNNLFQPAYIYRNNTDGSGRYLQVLLEPDSGRSAIGARVRLDYAGGSRVQELYPQRGYLSSGPRLLHFGLGSLAAGTQVQRLTVSWPDGQRRRLGNIATDQRITVRPTDGRAVTLDEAVATLPLFQSIPSPIDLDPTQPDDSDFDQQPLLPHSLSDPGPQLLTADVNKDTRLDLIVGAYGSEPTTVLLREAGGNYAPPIPLSASVGTTVTDLLVMDLNGDGNPDLYQANAGYGAHSTSDTMTQDLWWKGDGRGTFTACRQLASDMNSPTGAVAGISRGDTVLLFVGGDVLPGRYPQSAPSRLLRRIGDGPFKVLKMNLPDVRLVSDAAWHDMDGDGLEELLVVGQWMAIRIFSLEGDRLVDKTDTYFDRPVTGWWNTLVIDDYNEDGMADLLVGNGGTNSIWTIDSNRMAYVYSGDLDENGSIDPIEFSYRGDTLYAKAGRDELLGQLAALRPVYPSYRSYAGSDGLGVLHHLDLDLSDGLFLEVERTQTSLYLQDNGKLRAASLPPQAQYGPVHAIRTIDVDDDGHLDLLLAGNESAARLDEGPTVANRGMLLRGRGDGTFEYVSQERSGLNVRGDVRSLAVDDRRLFFGIRNRGVVAYEGVHE